MALGNSHVRTAPVRAARLLRGSLIAGLALSTLLAPGPAFAKDKEKAPVLPRLGMDPGEPQVRSAPPALPFAIPPATSKEYVLDFHGYLLLPLRLGLNEREHPGDGQSALVLHAPPLIPQDYRRFQYTAVVPDPYIQLGFTYGNRVVAGTAILAATTAYDAEAAYDPVRQLGVRAAYVSLNLAEPVGIPLQLRVGAMAHRYGSMGAFDSGRYATPLIARVNAIGETATAAFELSEGITLVLEQGIGGQLGRMPSALASSGWNDFADPDAGASFVNHVHAGLGLFQRVQLGAHYITAFTQDDQYLDQATADGRITVLGADARLTAGPYGHLYLGAARTEAVNANSVSGIIEVLNARGGRGLTNEYFGEASNGDGALTTFGAQYDLSLSNLLFPEDYIGKNSDVLVSLFGIGTSVESDDPERDGVLKLKAGTELTYNITSWFGTSGRVDHVRLDNEFNRRSFNTYTARLLFHSDWQSRDEFALSYSHFVYGNEVYASRGYPPVDQPSLNPDRHVFSLSATFWW
jgi:hypothetical protein